MFFADIFRPDCRLDPGRRNVMRQHNSVAPGIFCGVTRHGFFRTPERIVAAAFRQDQHQFLAAEATHHITVTHAFLKAMRNAAQHHIAGIMAIRIVDIIDLSLSSIFMKGAVKGRCITIACTSMLTEANYSIHRMVLNVNTG
jgi:hypothetical protein